MPVSPAELLIVESGGGVGLEATGELLLEGSAATTVAPVVGGRLELRVYSYDLSNIPHDLTGDIAGLSFSSSAPGGFRECTFSLLRDPRLPHLDIGYNYLLRVRRAMDTAWEGRIEDIGITPHEWQLNVRALGMISSCHDRWAVAPWTNTAAEQSPEDVIKYMLTTYCSDISADQSNIAATGVTQPATGTLSYVDTDSVKVFDDMLAFGNSTYADTMYLVWGGLQPPETWAGGLFYFAAKETAPSYYVRLEAAELEYEQSLEDYANRVKVQSDGGTWTTVNNTAEQALLGRGGGTFIKKYVVDTFKDVHTLNATARTQIANTYLARLIQRRARGKSLKIASGTPIESVTGLPVYLWQVRAGHVIRVTGIQPRASLIDGSASLERDIYIAQTAYDADSDSLTITPEDAKDQVDRQIARLLKAVKM